MPIVFNCVVIFFWYKWNTKKKDIREKKNVFMVIPKQTPLVRSCAPEIEVAGWYYWLITDRGSIESDSKASFSYKRMQKASDNIPYRQLLWKLQSWYSHHPLDLHHPNLLSPKQAGININFYPTKQQ